MGRGDRVSQAPFRAKSYAVGEGRELAPTPVQPGASQRSGLAAAHPVLKRAIVSPLERGDEICALAMLVIVAVVVSV